MDSHPYASLWVHRAAGAISCTAHSPGCCRVVMRLRGFDAAPQQQGLYASVAMPRCRPHQSPELHGLLVYTFVFRFLASAHELHIRELRLQTATEPFAASDPSGEPVRCGGGALAYPSASRRGPGSYFACLISFRF